MPANFRADQPSGAGAGVAGQARDDLWEECEIELHDIGTGMVASREWFLDDKPAGSGSTLSFSTATPSTFTPDPQGSENGTYKVTLRYDGVSDPTLGATYEANNKTLVLRVTKNAAGNPLPDLYPLPAFLEEDRHSFGIVGQGPAPGKGYAPLLLNIRNRMLLLITSVDSLLASIGTATDIADPNTLVLRDGSGNTHFNIVRANQLLSDTALVIGAQAGTHISFWEGATEVSRMFDNAGVRSLAFQGGGAAEVTSGGALHVAGTSITLDSDLITLRNAAASDLFTATRTSDISILDGKSSSGTRIKTTNGVLLLAVGGTDVVEVSTEGVAFGGATESDQDGAIKIVGVSAPSGNPSSGAVFVRWDDTNKCLEQRDSAGLISSIASQEADYVHHTSGTPTMTIGKVNVLSGTVSAVTLPAVVDRKTVVIQKRGLAADIVVSRTGGDTINGATTFTITGAYGAATFLGTTTTSNEWMTFGP